MSSRRRSHRLRRRRGVVMLTATPLIDIVFLLLLYFLLATELRPDERALHTLAPPEDSPRATDPFALPARPVVIELTSRGSGADAYALRCAHPALDSLERADSLRSALGAALASGGLDAETDVVIRADPDAFWEHVVRTIADARDAGMTRVRIVEPRMERDS